ncbi:hypothetical protein GMST_29060 [Geomonas silvestris]|uniref:Lipoprotein n=1 Tax=Geomonas silvestris TaxID=2740184 RepID=A0A6V8MKN2_9BACT|nr:hypothetical protein [Geomonas silvestris]GFO60581.1 hypothetical protein GMST_29060 [Geomonas silvestris]
MKKTTLLVVSLFILSICSGCGSAGPSASQPAAGPTSRSYQLSLQGSVSPGQVTGLSFDLVLPAGVQLPLDSQDQTVLPAGLALSASAPSGALMEGRVASGVLTVALVSASGLAKGGFATLTAGIPAGASAPSASAFAVTNLQALDLNGTPLTGAAVTVVDPP